MLADDGGNRMPVIVVDDLVRAIGRTLVADAAVGQAYNVAGQQQVTKDAVLNLFRDAGLLPLQRGGWRRYAADGLATAARAARVVEHGLGRAPGEPLLPQPLLRRIEGYARRRAQRDCLLDCSRAMDDLGWHATADYAEAVRRTLEWHRRYVAAA
jgi:nucleoside-diphosphate-sugar epimerase